MIQATVTIGIKQWAVEVATTHNELAAGLSGMSSLLPGQGMLFDLGSERVVTVNAYEMLFPLSVVFIGKDLKVTYVKSLLMPGDDVTTSYPCRYFLEVNVGEADNIELGDLVTITGYTPAVPTSIIGLMVTVLIVTMMMKMMAQIMKEVK